MPAYSFVNVSASITGPGGSFQLGSGSANTDEGIQIEFNSDRDIMTIALDGTPIHSLNPDKSAKVTVTLSKVSPANAKLSAMFDGQSLSSSLWANNTITIQDSASGDTTVCRSVAFTKKPTTSYGKEAGNMQWVFNCGLVDSVLGTY